MNMPSPEQSNNWDETRRPARDTEDWLAAIGPEDEDREVILDGLEDYGFDLRDEDDQNDNPIPLTPSDWGDTEGEPTELQQRIRQSNINQDHFRPVEEEVLDAIVEDRPPDDGMSLPE